MAYVADRKYADQKDIVGNGECVALVKQLTGACASSLWWKGDSVAELIKKGTIAEGTAIATH
ncbi:BPSL0067 family protein [Janthinobacterium fluminis]|uniref:BPSL0067 family protein n=1 Tax=Janthinobacterium fluminis TaxID=2987524 RepID=A0ABT5K978_9BURK|nr:BPSL0067 family protein [Janthinobacterium fluminis]MDC8760347.1 BPSL0067 family protein [Janthinobacterium fluminis]